MARLRYLDQSDLAEADKDLLSRPINLNRILVHSPGARRAGLGMANFIRYGSKLDPRLRELAILAVGYIGRADYEWSHHIKLGKEFGVTSQDVGHLIEAIEGRPSRLDPTAKLVVEGAVEMSRDGAISEPVFDRLREALDDERLVELIVTLGYYNGVVRILKTLQVDVEEEYLPALREFPLA
jgi:alkylhydroperoxidase family enzyme